MRIIVDSTNVTEKKGTGEKGPWSFRNQLAYVDTGKRYPAEIKIRLAGDEPAFPVGEYEVDLAASVYISKYGSLALSEELKLVRVQQETPAKLASAK